MATEEPLIRYATEEDVPTILTLIQELATYEKASSSVIATTSSLLATLSFPISSSSSSTSSPTSSTSITPPKFTPGYAKTLLIFPPTSSPSCPPTPSPPCAGLALFFPNYSTWRSAPGIYLEDLYIKPEHRGKGYGTRLLRRLARECVDIGGQRLEWSVLKWNQPSLAFYEGLGAKRLEEWVGCRVEGEELGRMAGGGDGREEERED